jgi:DNA-binding MarR family transcriptional regulator
VQSSETRPSELLDETLLAANALLRVAARTVIEVEDRVTSPQLRVLVLIARNGPQPPSAVAVELDVHASNATRICSRLERSGLVVRTESAEDRRFALFSLSASGRTLVDSVLDRRREAIQEVLTRVPPAERTSVLRAFRIFAAAAETVEPGDGRFDLTLQSG